MKTRNRTSRGAATVELVLLTPVLIVMLLFVVALGRLASTRQDVDAAARDAARAAANARSATTAQADGDTAARNSLDTGRVGCRELTVTIDTDNFRAGGTVVARVTCTVDLGDLTGLRVPATRAITATFTSPIDQYRATS